MTLSDPVTSTTTSLSKVTNGFGTLMLTVALFRSVGTAITETLVVPNGAMKVSPSSTSTPSIVNVASEVSTGAPFAFAALSPLSGNTARSSAVNTVSNFLVVIFIVPLLFSGFLIMPSPSPCKWQQCRQQP